MKISAKEYDISTFLWFPGCILFFGYCKHYLENVDFISWVLLETRRCIFTNFCVEVLYPMDVPEELWFQANCECFAPAVSILFISNKDFSVFVCIFKCFVCFLVQFFCVIVILKRGLPMFILFLIQYFRDLIFILWVNPLIRVLKWLCRN